LLRIDCNGSLRSGLAESFAPGPQAGEFTFTLRRDARWWSGEAVTAASVVAAWNQLAWPGPTAPNRDLVASARATGERTVTMSLPRSELPYLALYHPAARRRQGSSWPEGTGAYRIVTVEQHGIGQESRVVLEATSGESPSTLIVRFAPATEARDRIDDGPDVLITGDPALSAYAARSLDATVVPLPWDEVYLLWAPYGAGLPGGHSPDSARHWLSLRSELASAVSGGDARPAEPANLPPHCGPSPEVSHRSTLSLPALPRISYASFQPVARALGERIAAFGAVIANSPDSALVLGTSGAPAVGAALQAVEVAPHELPRPASAVSRDVASVIPRMRRVAHLCEDWPAFARTALIPLVDTRAHLVARPHRVGLTVDLDATLRLMPRR
jgi:hypothetical protein